MEKKTYIAPRLHVHEIVLEAMMNQVSLGNVNDPNGGPRVDSSSAMAKGMGGPIFDDEDYDEFDDDF